MLTKMDVAMSSFKIKFLKALYMIWNPLFSSEYELRNLYLDFSGFNKRLHSCKWRYYFYFLTLNLC